jgi:hypothetical protein
LSEGDTEGTKAVKEEMRRIMAIKPTNERNCKGMTKERGNKVRKIR